MQGEAEIIKRKRDNDGQSHVEKQRGVKIVRSSVGRIRVKKDSVVAVGSRIVMKPVLTHRRKGHRTHFEQTRHWSFEVHRGGVRSNRSRVRRVKGEKNVADLGIKTLNKAVISKHSITLEFADMAEERVEDAQQDVAMFWDFSSGPGGRTSTSQNTAGDHAKQQ